MSWHIKEMRKCLEQNLGIKLSFQKFRPMCLLGKPPFSLRKVKSRDLFRFQFWIEEIKFMRAKYIFLNS
jgi:hypothetical protein